MTSIVFFPGFLTRPSLYSEFLNGLAQVGEVIAVRESARQLRKGSINHSVRQWSDVSRHNWLVGHSRGGQVAHRIATQAPVAGVVLLDPVAGEGPSSKPDPLPALPAELPSLVVGAGISGPCNPEELNFRNFPAQQVTILDDMGHADVLNSSFAGSLGRTLCRSASDPDRVRQQLIALTTQFITDRT